MAIYPPAIQRPWHPYSPERFIRPTTFILHTNAVNAEDPGSTSGLTWHFQIGEHGDVYQHRDTITRAAANADANDFAISCETWDGGDPEHNPWTVEQVAAIISLIHWCSLVHGIPLVRPARWDAPGVSYHRAFPEWNQPVHSCPGNLRAAQFDNDIWPRIVAPTPPHPITEDDMKVFQLVGGGFVLYRPALATEPFVIINNDANHDNLTNLAQACEQDPTHLPSITAAQANAMGGHF